MINYFKLFSLPNYSVFNRIPNKDIWLQTEYQLFGCNPALNYDVIKVCSLVILFYFTYMISFDLFHKQRIFYVQGDM